MITLEHNKDNAEYTLRFKTCGYDLYAGSDKLSNAATGLGIAIAHDIVDVSFRELDAFKCVRSEEYMLGMVDYLVKFCDKSVDNGWAVDLWFERPSGWDDSYFYHKDTGKELILDNLKKHYTLVSIQLIRCQDDDTMKITFDTGDESHYKPSYKIEVFDKQRTYIYACGDKCCELSVTIAHNIKNYVLDNLVTL